MTGEQILLAPLTGNPADDVDAISAGTGQKLSVESLGGSMGTNPTAVQTAAYTALPGDDVRVDISAGTVPVTLPTAPADKTRIGLKIVKVSGTPGSTTATLHCGGSDVFNVASGSTTLTVTALFQGVIAQYHAADGIWVVQSTDTPLGTALGAAKLGSDGTVGGPSGSAPNALLASGASAASQGGVIWNGHAWVSDHPRQQSARLQSMAQEPVMPIPPVVTVGAAGNPATSAIASSVLMAMSSANAPFVYEGIPNQTAQAFGTLPPGGGPQLNANGRYYAPSALALYNAGVDDGRGYIRIAFDTDAIKFEWRTYGFASLTYRMWVNERLISATPQTIVTVTDTSPTGDRYIEFDFTNAGGKQMRRIVLEIDASHSGGTAGEYPYFGGITLLATDQILPPSSPRAPRMAFVHDSYGAGSGAGEQGAPFNMQGFPWKLARYLGFEEVNLSIPGTGYLNPGGGSGGETYILRLGDLEAMAPPPDVIVAPVSWNDRSGANAAYTIAALDTAIRAYVTAVRASTLPNAATVPIVIPGIVVGFTWDTADGGVSANTGTKAANDQARTTVASIASSDPNVYWVESDPLESLTVGHWSYGTGDQGSPTGDGPADNYMWTSGEHPNASGHGVLASWLGQKIATVLGLRTASTPPAASGASVLLATNATWPIPTGATLLEIECVGGGGGGGGGGTNSGAAANTGGGGGGAGGYQKAIVPVGANTTLTVTVGAGGALGAGGASGGHNGGGGGQGGQTSVTGTGISVAAQGGAGGGGGPATATTTVSGGIMGANATGGGLTSGAEPGGGGTSVSAAAGPGGNPVGLSGGGGGGGGPSSTTLGGGGGGAGTGSLGGAAGGTGASGSSAGVVGATAAANSGGGAGGGGGAPSGGAGGNGGVGASGYVVIKVLG